MVRRRAYSDAEVDRAVRALAEPERLTEAQQLIAAGAPALQRILGQALEEADWFGPAHQTQVLEAAGKADVDERLSAVRTLLAEETRLSMLIGAAVGYELAHVLMDNDKEAPDGGS